MGSRKDEYGRANMISSCRYIASLQTLVPLGKVVVVFYMLHGGRRPVGAVRSSIALKTCLLRLSLPGSLALLDNIIAV
jgi:hypothetical protein